MLVKAVGDTTRPESAMTTVHVHLGGAKTGTTTFQMCMNLSRDGLMEHGFRYSSSAGKTNHVRMFCAFSDNLKSNRHRAFGLTTPAKRRTFRKSFVEAFDRERAAHPNVDFIVSSEHFFGMGASDIEEMRKFLFRRFDNVKIYYYFRNPVDLEISLYSTYVKSGVTWSFKKRVNFNKPSRHLRLQMWEKAFGAENVMVCFFHRNALVNGSIVDDILTKIGVDPSVAVMPKEDSNRTLDIPTIEILRHLNATVFAGKPDAKEKRIRFERLLQRASSGEAPCVSPETATRIFDAYRETVDYLSQRSGTPVDEILQTKRISATGPTLESYKLSVEDAMRAFAIVNAQ